MSHFVLKMCIYKWKTT